MASIFQNEYTVAILIILLFIILAKVIVYLVKKFVFKLTAKTKTDLDDKIVEIVTPQVYSILILAGTYFALRALTVLDPYAQQIGGFFFVLAVLFITFAVSRVVRVMVLHFLHVQKKFEKAPQLINRIINVIIYAIATLIILDHFNISITPIMATLGVGAVAVGLALQGTLSNLFAGMRVLSDRKINLGNYIEMEGGISGYVEDISWSTTTIQTLSNTIVVIPNSKIADSIVTNYSIPQDETSVVVQCGVSYKSNLKKVERVTLEVAEKIQKTIGGAARSFKPSMRYHTFGESNINFSIVLRAEHITEKYKITHEFIKALKERFDKEKINIAFPTVKIVKG